MKTKLDELIFPKGLEWLKRATGGLHPCMSYLVSGSPGVGKTRLVMETAASLASNNSNVLYYATEQSIEELQGILYKISTANGLPFGCLANRIRIHDKPFSNNDLPSLLKSESTSPANLIIVDSVQGRGLSPTAKNYQGLYQMMNDCKHNEQTLLLVSHITKDNKIAGPKDLEHNCDIIIDIRRAGARRLLRISKNRAGPDMHDPMVLDMTDDGILKESKYVFAKTYSACGYNAAADAISECQVNLTIPPIGTKPVIAAPGSCKSKIRQCIKTISSVLGVPPLYTEFTIDFDIPYDDRSQIYLAVSAAFLSSYSLVELKQNTIFVGNVRLKGSIDPVPHNYLHRLASWLKNTHHRTKYEIVLPKHSRTDLYRCIWKMQTKCPSRIRVVGVSDLNELIAMYWPELLNGSVH